MRIYFFALFILFVPLKSVSQTSLSRVNQHAATLGYYPLDILADKLTTPFYTDSEKVRAIFYWITTHITYDVNEYHNKHVMHAELSFTDSEKVEAYFRNRLAEEAINKKMAICAGYAALFKELCDRAKINCVIVEGYAKLTLNEVGKPFNENHAWNAVKLNGNWVLIDACWAAGYCDENVTQFTRKQDEFFYMTPPWLFIYNHYPKDGKWTLMNSPMSKDQYAAYPKWMLFKKNLIKANFTPVTGVLSPKIGDTIKFEVELCESDSVSAPRKLEVQEIDVAKYIMDHEQPIKPQQQILNNIKKRITYNYVVWSKASKELLLAYGDEYLVSYKLEVR